MNLEVNLAPVILFHPANKLIHQNIEIAVGCHEALIGVFFIDDRVLVFIGSLQNEVDFLQIEVLPLEGVVEVQFEKTKLDWRNIHPQMH